MSFEYGYYGLFLASFLAATILPVASEAILSGMLVYGFDPLTTLLVATSGNTLGSWLNYGIGSIGNPKWLEKMGAKPQSIEKWQTKVQHFGSWMALLCWLPLIGDIIGIALGFFKAPWLPTFIFMGIGKLIRYLLVLAGFYYFW